MSQRRPKFLNLRQIHMPVTAWVSILHRISGVVLFISLPFILTGMEALYESAASFERLSRWLAEPWLRGFALALLLLFIYHLLAGTRYLLFDLHIGTQRRAARRSAFAVLVVTLLGAAIIVIGTR